MKTNRRQFIHFFGLGPLALLSSSKKRSQESERKPAPLFSSPSPAVWIELNLDSLNWNLERLRKLVKIPIMAVIKANAYGHGLTEVGRCLEKQGIDSLMVGNFQEAVQLREAGISSSILHFGPLSSADPDWLIHSDITQSVFTDEISALDVSARRIGKKAKVHIHIDTGMGRMGIPYHRANPYIEKVISLEGIKIDGISTTLTEDPEFDPLQMKRFLSICTFWEQRGIHLGNKHAASSAAALDMPSAHLDKIRPGIILYGHYPSERARMEKKIDLKPILQLKCRVAAVKELRPGDSVSYHRAFIARERQSIAVLPIGYSDGYPSSAVNGGRVLIGGKPHSLVAGVTANHLQAVLSDGVSATIGAEAVLIGNQGDSEIKAEDIAQWTGQSVYKILLSLNPSLPKRIISS